MTRSSRWNTLHLSNNFLISSSVWLAGMVSTRAYIASQLVECLDRDGGSTHPKQGKTYHERALSRKSSLDGLQIVIGFVLLRLLLDFATEKRIRTCWEKRMESNTDRLHSRRRRSCRSHLPTLHSRQRGSVLLAFQ